MSEPSIYGVIENAPVASDRQRPRRGEDNEGRFNACLDCSQDRTMAGEAGA